MDLPRSFGSTSYLRYRPSCKVSTGSTGGLTDVAASLLGAPQADPWAANLQSAEIVDVPAPGLPACSLKLALGSNPPEVALEDELSVALGYDKTLNTVFAGQVVALRRLSEGGLALQLAGAVLPLAQLRQNTSLEQRTLGDIARQWAGETGLTPGNIDSGPSYPFLAMDDRLSAWEWLAHLSRHAGFLAWVDAEGKLHCKRPAGPPARTYHHGQDLFAFSHTERIPWTGEVTVNGEGAAGSQGANAWSWHAKRADATTSTAGQGHPKRFYQEGFLRNHAALDASSAGLAETAARFQDLVRATVPGSPELGVASIFALADCPDGRGNGTFLALQVRHRYDKIHGYRTELAGVRL